MTFGERVISALSYEAALYDTHVTNEIVPYRGGRFYFTAGKARRSGAELGAVLIGTGGLELSSNLTLSRNRYVSYTVDSVHYGRPGRTADYAGNDIAGVPSVFYNASLGRAVSDAIPLRVSINMRGVGDYFVDDANSVEVPAYHTFGATISTARGLVVGGAALRAFFTVENLGDRRYIGSAFVNPDVVNGLPVAFEPGAGRTYLFSVSVGPRSR